MDAQRAARFPFVPQDTPPIVIERTEDVWLIRDNGDRILDAGGGAIVTNIGHGRADVVQAATQALGQVDYVVPLWATEHRVALVEELTEHWLPEGFTQASFFCGGSESVDAAVRLARTHHVSNGDSNRWKVIGRDVSYHGSTLSGLSVGNHDRRRSGLEPMLHDHPKSDWLDAESLAKVIEREDPETRLSIHRRTDQRRIGRSDGATCGVLASDPGSLPSQRRVIDRRRSHDWPRSHRPEMGTRALRHHPRHHRRRQRPVRWLRADGRHVQHAEPSSTRSPEAGNGLMYFTFSGADLGCAVSVKVLQIMRQEALVERAATMGALLRRRLEEELTDHPQVADIRGLGLMQGIELVKDRNSGESFATTDGFAQRVAMEAIDRGVWLYPCGSGPVVDGLLFGPPYTITEDHIETIVGVTAESITAAAASLS